MSNSSCQTLRSLYCVTHHNTTVLQNDKMLAISQIFRVICQKILFVFIYLPVTLLLFLFFSQPTAEILLASTQRICSSFSTHLFPVIFCRYLFQILSSQQISFLLLLSYPSENTRFHTREST